MAKRTPASPKKPARGQQRSRQKPERYVTIIETTYSKHRPARPGEQAWLVFQHDVLPTLILFAAILFGVWLGLVFSGASLPAKQADDGQEIVIPQRKDEAEPAPEPKLEPVPEPVLSRARPIDPRV